MEKINLKEIGRNIITFKDNPGKLDDINLTLAGWYSYYNSLLIPLELKEASFWEKHKDIEAEKPKSDAFVRALWKISIEGQQMIEYERTIKTIEKLMSTLRSSLSRHTAELRNIN